MEFLGVTINEKFKFYIHCNALLGKLNRVSAIIWKPRDILSKSWQECYTYGLDGPNLLMVCWLGAD